MSPTNNPVFSTSSDILYCTIPGPSSVYENLPKPQTLLLECAYENDAVENRGAEKILDTESSISRPVECLRHLLIHIGNNDQVTSALSECILQGLTLRGYGDDCVLPGDKYPYWQCLKGEGVFVKFKVPLVSSCELKGMTPCCEYYSKRDSSNVEFDSSISMLIINYTKMTTLHYRQDTLASLEEAKWKDMISNLDYNDQVEITVVFANGFTVKRTAVYLKYYELFEAKIEDPSSSSTIGSLKLLF